MPVDYDGNLRSEPLQTIEIPTQSIERNYFSNEQLISYVNFPESYSALILRLINITYARQFKLNTPRASFTIDFSEIEQALTILNIGGKAYSIISFGLSIPEITLLKTNPIHFINAQYSELIIIPTDEMPYITLSQTPIIISVIENEENKEYMKINGRLTYSFEQPHFIHYLKLRVVFRDYQGISSQLYRIQAITNYL